MQAIEIQSEGELTTRLENAGVNLDIWGQPVSGKITKPVSALWEEISKGPTKMVLADERLFRCIEVAAPTVLYEGLSAIGSRDVHMRLIESHRKKGGIVERRGLDGMASMGEKLNRGETVTAAMIRAVHEELGLTLDPSQVALGYQGQDGIERTGDSGSFPGLQTMYRIHYGEIWLNGDQFRLGGYKTEEKGRTSHFLWVLDPK